MATNNKNNKIIVILGPTASGKTNLAVKLACKFDGEIVSADSRQVYKGMDIGTGKDLDEYNLRITNYELRITNKIKKYKIVKIPHHLIDVVSPMAEFNLAKYQKLARKAVDDILKRGKLPIIAGGSGLYLQAVVDGFNLSATKPNPELRKKLKKFNVDRLFKKLQKLNLNFANKLNESDRKNSRRLIRYIEIARDTKHAICDKYDNKYEFLLIGLTMPKNILRERIYKRLIERLKKEDMIGEVERLHKQGVTWKRLNNFGLEYKFISLCLRKRLTYDEMVEKLNIAIRQFAKKQMTWFRKWERQRKKIYWVKSEKEANMLVNKFIKQ